MNILVEGIKNAFQAVFDFKPEETQIQLQPTRKDFEGSVTLVTFPFAKQTKTSPQEVADKIGAYMKEHESVISDYNVVKGFLNFSLSESIWHGVISEILNRDNYGIKEDSGEKIMVEYSSPNTNKPLHLGHLRNNFLGYALSNILEANGHQVIKANLINDRGIHICKSMLAYEKFGNGETPESTDIKGDHLVGKYYVIFDQEYKKEIKKLVDEGVDKDTAEKEAPLMRQAREILQKWEKGDESTVALWKKMNEWVYDGFNKTYDRIGVSFDQFYYESDTYLLGKDVVNEGLDKNVFYKKDDGSVWADLSEDKLDDKLVLRGDGTSVYMTQDIGTADLKYKDYHLDRSIYVVGDEQEYHFKVLQLILQKLDRPYAKGIHHMSYGMVDLPSGKMKSREGTVVDADDLIDELIETARQRTDELGKIEGFTEDELKELYRVLALGAIKYFLLRVDPKKRMLFNPEESVDFQGNTGPFIQYTHARISAIVRKAKAEIEEYSKYQLQDYTMHDSELALAELLEKFPEKVNEAGSSYAPSIVANYVYDLAKAYNKFYAECSIYQSGNDEVMKYRISLSAAAGTIINKGMALLGIEVPERM